MSPTDQDRSTLPAADQAAQAARPVVHVVDDQPEVQELFRNLARSQGFELASYTTAQGFLDAFENGRPGCIVLDLILGEESGLDVLRELARRGCRTPVVFMSGLARVSEAVSALKLGSLDFIEKPFQIADMLSAIHAALRSDTQTRQRARTEDNLRARFATLTQREQQVMRLVVEGQSNRLIASGLGVSPKTVEVHRAHVMQKTAADSLAELVKMAIATGQAKTMVPAAPTL